MKPPNILWICTDQQRPDTLGCYDNPWVKTPNLDALAKRGMLFEKAFAQSPVCSPSRASFLTGRYPRTCRCRQNGQAIPADEVPVTRLLDEAGYRCGLAGKLHLSPCHPKVAPEMERRIEDGYEVFHWSHHPMGGWGNHNAYWAWLEQQGQTYTTRGHPECRLIGEGMPAEYHQTTWCADRAIDHINEARQDKRPWLFSVNFFDPHHGFDPPASHLARYADFIDDLPLPEYHDGELENKSSFQHLDHAGAYNKPGSYAWSSMTSRDHRWVKAAYYAMIDLIDEQVGRILDALERSGQIDNTLIIFMSDHGEMLGDHGIYLKGPYFYDPAIQVPLIVAGPGVKPGSTKALVELVDIAPTLLETAGLPRHNGMQGLSLWPLLHDPADPHRDSVYCEYYNAMPWHKKPEAHLTMVRTDRFKLTVNHSENSGELYALDSDPGETNNRWNDPALTAIQSELLLQLTHRMAWTADPLPVREAAF